MKELSFVPEIDSVYVPFGNFHKILTVFKSKQFYPLWITGNSGNGKTKMIEQACAHTEREFIRVNFTTETDENDLLGGFRLENGNTVFHEGPVTMALRRGAILLLDEIDIGHTNKIMCLQSIMEGKGVMLKAIGEFVHPAPGFTVVATSNTKGKGSDDGRFIGANILNSAFLDRFVGMLYQDYPEPDYEQEILKKYFSKFINANPEWKKRTDEMTDKEAETFVANEVLFFAKLCKWAGMIRQNHKEQRCEEVITTRTLINIVQGYIIFKDKNAAIDMACERYPEPVKKSFMEFYNKIGDENFSTGDSPKSKKTKEEYHTI